MSLSSAVSSWHGRQLRGRGLEFEHRPGAAAWDGQCPNPHSPEHGPWGREDIEWPLILGDRDSRAWQGRGQTRAPGPLPEYIPHPISHPDGWDNRSRSLSSMNIAVLLCSDVLKTNPCFPGERDGRKTCSPTQPGLSHPLCKWHAKEAAATVSWEKLAFVPLLSFLWRKSYQDKFVDIKSKDLW